MFGDHWVSTDWLNEAWRMAVVAVEAVLCVVLSDALELIVHRAVRSCSLQSLCQPGRYQQRLWHTLGQDRLRRALLVACWQVHARRVWASRGWMRTWSAENRRWVTTAVPVVYQSSFIFHVVQAVVTCHCAELKIRSTLQQSWPSEGGLVCPCMRTYVYACVHPSVQPQKVSSISVKFSV